MNTFSLCIYATKYRYQQKRKIFFNLMPQKLRNKFSCWLQLSPCPTYFFSITLRQKTGVFNNAVKETGEDVLVAIVVGEPTAI